MANKKSSHTQTKAIRQKKETKITAKSPAPRVKARNFRKTAKDEIEKNYQNIVQKLGEKAVSGSIQHTKILFDLGGVDDEVKAASSNKKRKSPSLGKLLLDEAKRVRQIAVKTSDHSSEQAPSK